MTTLSSEFTNQYELKLLPANSSTFAQPSSNSGSGFGALPCSTDRRIMELWVKYNF